MTRLFEDCCVKKIFSTVFVWAAFFNIHAQTGSTTGKPPIDNGVPGTWPVVGVSNSISNDGKYTLYAIDNYPLRDRTIVVQSTDAKWKTELPERSNVMLTPNSKYAVYTMAGDSLAILTLGSEAIEYIPGSHTYQLPKNGDWILYKLSSASKTAVAYNPKSKERKTYDQVNGCWLNEDGETLLLHAATENRTEVFKSVSLKNGKENIIWEGKDANNIVSDGKGRIAFIADEKQNERTVKSVWYYATGMEKVIPVVQLIPPAISKELKIASLDRFSKAGNKLFITLQENKPFRPPVRPGSDAVKLTVWSYNDTILQSNQVGNASVSSMIAAHKEEYMAVIDLEKHNLIRLEQEPAEIKIRHTNDVFLTSDLIRGGDSFEEPWNKGIRRPLYLVNAKDGQRQELSTLGNIIRPEISAAEKYLLYWNPKEKNFFTYEIATGTIRNITKNITAAWINELEDQVNAGPVGPGGWLTDDEAVLLYDQFDIWLIDPKAVKAPVNVTNGYGSRHSISFRLAQQDGQNSAGYLVSSKTEKLILNAFNRLTKDNGFYTINMKKKGDPELLTKGAYVYQLKFSVARRSISGIPPIKARDAEMYIVRRMSAAEYPNLFSTSNFKTFTALSDFHPQKAYNWMTTEVHSWKDPKGKAIQGLLYKPENFDPSKKYPVIFYYYERMSDNANVFQMPEHSDGRLNIPWYVSNGYLVFQPDIQITTAEPGPSAIDAVVSGANYLSQKPYVNSQKMGIQGISYGGFETYYIVTQSNLFVAACAAAGFTDFISFYNYQWGEQTSNQTMFETGQMRMGKTMWEIPGNYIRNSPVLYADKVTTPLLMLGGRQDLGVHISQAIEFYLSMRRLGKRAWLLDYADGGHGLDGKDAKDFSIRMTQFFDHYLKDKPAPKWMMEGIPANKKGIERGLELVKEKDSNGKWVTPGKGLLTAEQQQMVDKLEKSRSLINF